MKIIDISVPLSDKTPTWPGSPKLHLQKLKQITAGDKCNNSYLHCDTHVGTHVDAPSHLFNGGRAVEQLSLQSLIGPALVAYLPDVAVVTARDLADLEIPGDTKRLLLRTRNSELWSCGETAFKEEFVALTSEAAQWIAGRRLCLVGIDYLSIQRYGDSPITHQILLEADVVIVEGLNLVNVEPGTYELICLPIPLVGADGAPARAVLRQGDVDTMAGPYGVGGRR